MRITKSHIQAKADYLNKITGSPLEAYTRAPDGKFVSNQGHFHISCAYGGYSLHRMVGEAGGVTDIFSCGHIPARELAERMSAFERGLEFNK
jgi:hypothetical protein